MKNIILIFLLTISLNSFAQRDFSYFTNFEYNIQNLISVEDGFVVLRKVGLRSIDIIKPIEAIRIDTLGNIKWKTTLPGIFSQSEVQQIFNISREGNYLHIFGSKTDCDVGGFSYSVRFCIINLVDGSMIEYGSNKQSSKNDTSEVGAIAKMANKYFSIFQTPNNNCIGTYNGDKLKVTESIEISPLTFCFNHNSNLILTQREIENSLSNEILLQLWDSNLNLVSQKLMKTKLCKYLGVLDKGFYGFFNDGGNGNSFFVFDSLLNEVRNLAFLNINYYTDNLIVNENRFFIIKNKYPSEIQIFNFNTGMVSETYKSKWSNILDIKEFNGTTYVLGLTAYNQLFIEKLQNSQTFNSGFKTGVDLEMSNLKGDFNISVDQGGFPFLKIYKTDFQNITAKVTNLGTEKIQGIEVKSKIYQNYFCPSSLDLKYKYPDIILNPGDSIYIDIPSLNVYRVSEISTMCYSVSTLNLKQDDNIDDNIICSPIVITATTELTSKEEVQLFPNPTYGILNIESSFPIKTIETFDIAGRKIMTKEIQSLHYQFDCSGLPNGYYLLHIKGGDRETFQRFIVQR